jgi:ribosomal protein S8E
LTRKRRAAGRKAALTRKRRAAGRKAAATRAARLKQMLGKVEAVGAASAAKPAVEEFGIDIAQRLATQTVN